MKKLLLLAFAALFLCSCAGVHVKKPEINDVKKIAIIGVTSNEEYKEDKSNENNQSGDKKKSKKKKAKDLLKTVAKNVITDNLKFLTEAQLEIITYGGDKLADAINGINGWSVEPFENVVNNEAYKEAFKEGKDVFNKIAKLTQKKRYTTPKKMYPIHFEAAHSQKDTEEAQLQGLLSSLCEPLGVDAVAVAEYTFMYKKASSSSATPVVFLNVAFVDKNGNEVLYTDKDWDRVEKGHAAYQHGLKLWEKKSINGYKSAIDKAVSTFKDGTQKALTKE